MEPFLVRYYKAVDRELGDPHSSARYPYEDRLSDLHDIDQAVFEELLNVAGQQSLMGYTEASVTLEVDRCFYPLPPGFRQLVELQYRQEGVVAQYLRSKTFYDNSYGVDILTADRGFRLFPAPNAVGGAATSAEWTLCYLRDPGLLHYATAAQVSVDSIRAGTPPDNGGSLHLIDDYYNGVSIRIVSSGNNAHPQTRVVESFRASGGGTFFLRDPLSPLPTGVVVYEICPTLPLKYDRIYAMDAAIPELIRREKLEKAEFLKRIRAERWRACTNHFMVNVMDRGPTRLHPLQEEDIIPSGEVPY